MRNIFPFRSSDDEDYASDEEATEYDEEASEAPTVGDSDTGSALKEMFSQKIACLLIFVPIAWVLHYVGEATGGEEGPIKPLYHFVTNFFAIIPLAWVISESTEHLEKKVGPMLGALLNQTFGNVVEIILSITAIAQGKVKLVQSSLLGAVLMNLNLVLGLCFLCAGLQKHKKRFNRYQATYNMGMLAVSSLALSVPTGLAIFDDWSTPSERLDLSHWVAGCLLLMYFQWLAFNLCTHTNLFDKKQKGNTHWFWAQGSGTKEVRDSYLELKDKDTSKKEKDETDDDDDDNDDGPAIHWVCACGMLAFCTVIVAFHCDWLVEAINPVCKEFHVKIAFVATVLIPMVGNFSEVIASVSIAYKGKLDLAMGVAIGSATQIALFVIPVVVLIAWGFGQPLDLDFEFFQVKILIISILVVTLLLLDGEANWLKGSLLITSYMIIISAFVFLHDREFASAGEPPELVAENRTSLSTSGGVTPEDRRLFSLWGF